MSHRIDLVPDMPAQRLTPAEPYGRPRKVWVEDGHVFVEGHDGAVVSMTPEVAIELSRLIGEAGAESLINKVMDHAAAGPGGQIPTPG